MPAIKAENLGKQYWIRHASGDEPYRTLRDTLTHSVKEFWSKKSTPGKKVSRASREKFWALKDVNFTIEHGTVTGIIGRNGAGKSTLLKLLSRITQPTSGRIELEGRVSSLLEVGTGFHPELSGRENIFLNGSILGMSRREIKKKLDEIVYFARVEKFLDTPVKRYSSGMYVRLAFAIAAHLETEILLVDEVLAVGDAEFQKKCLGKMNSIAQSGRTVLFVSHNMATIKRLCERGLYFQNGTLRLEDSIETCVATYLDDVNDRGHESSVFERDESEIGQLKPGSARIRSVRINDDSENPISCINLGDSINIEFEVDYADPQDVFWHSIQIRNTDGQNLYNIYDLDTRTQPLPAGKRRKITVRIPEWKFVADRYEVSLWIGNASRGTADTLEDVVSFESLSTHPELRRTLKKGQELVWEPLHWDYTSL